MKVDIGISAANLTQVHKVLNNVLANGNILYIKLRNFHWNLKGKDFVEYHELFEEQYEQVAEAVDAVAERIASLGGTAIGTTSEFASASNLKETPGKLPANLEMVKQLVKDHETIIKGLRKAVDDCDEKYKDMGTSDFLTGLMTDHEKMAWKLRQYLL